MPALIYILQEKSAHHKDYRYCFSAGIYSYYQNANRLHKRMMTGSHCVLADLQGLNVSAYHFLIPQIHFDKMATNLIKMEAQQKFFHLHLRNCSNTSFALKANLRKE